MDKKILIAAPINEEENIFKEYLESLNHLEIPEGYTAKGYCILAKDSPLYKYLDDGEYEFENNNFPVEKSKGRQWTNQMLSNVGYLKNKIKEKATREGYDYLFMVDGDILLHPKTLSHLISLNKPVVTELVYTKRGTKIGCMDGEYEGNTFYSDKKLRDYQDGGLHEVNWSGQIMLIHSSVFTIPTIDFSPIGQMIGEYNSDWSFFCKVYAHDPNFQLYMDTKYPARHLYSEKDYKRWMEEKKHHE